MIHHCKGFDLGSQILIIIMIWHPQFKLYHLKPQTLLCIFQFFSFCWSVRPRILASNAFLHTTVIMTPSPSTQRKVLRITTLEIRLFFIFNCKIFTQWTKIITTGLRLGRVMIQHFKQLVTLFIVSTPVL